MGPLAYRGGKENPRGHLKAVAGFQAEVLSSSNKSISENHRKDSFDMRLIKHPICTHIK